MIGVQRKYPRTRIVGYVDGLAAGAYRKGSRSRSVEFSHFRPVVGSNPEGETAIPTVELPAIPDSVAKTIEPLGATARSMAPGQCGDRPLLHVLIGPPPSGTE